MINNKTTYSTKKVESVIGKVYEAVEGASYSHHASITWFRGKFWAMWSNGFVNEDWPGQRVMLAESQDGVNWDKPYPVVTPEMLGDRRLALTAAGFHVHEDTLYVYYGSYGFKEYEIQEENGEIIPKGGHTATDLGVVSTKDGVNWSCPRSLGIALVPNHGPQKLASGRLLISGNIMYPYTDNPNGVEGYQLSGIYGDAFQDRKLYDDSESIHHNTSYHGWDARLICEGSFYQTDDQVIHMMLRSNTDILWCTESRDDGVTWSDPYKTAYTDDRSKFHFGRLPDGRFYGVSNAYPAEDQGERRKSLVVCLSKDGENFDRHYILREEPYTKRFEGLYKGGIYGYPHTYIHEGYMYVIYSKRKENVEVTRFSLDQLN